MSSSLNSDETDLASYVRRAVKHPLMWMPRGTYYELCSLVTGLQYAPGEDLLKRYQAWLAARNPEIKNQVHWALVLRETVYRARDGLPTLSPDEDEAARLAYGRLFDEFLAEEQPTAGEA